MAVTTYKNLRLAKDRLKVLLNQAKRQVKFGNSRYGDNRKRSTQFFTKAEAKKRLSVISQAKEVLDKAPRLKPIKGVKYSPTTRLKVDASMKAVIQKALQGRIVPKYKDVVVSRKITAKNAGSQRIKALAAATNFKKRTTAGKKDLQRLREFYNKTSAPRKDRLGYIYKITDTKSGKVYIGQTVKNPRVRFTEHKNDTGTPLDDLITKKNVSRFKLETLAKTTSRERLDKLEAKYIQKFKARDPNKGLNVKIGNKVSASLARYRFNSFKKANSSSAIKKAVAKINKKSSKVKFTSKGQRK